MVNNFIKTAALILACCLSAEAQLYIGAEAGRARSNVTGEVYVNRTGSSVYKAVAGNTASVFGGMQISNLLMIETGLGYAERGYEFETVVRQSIAQETNQLQYLTLPVMVKYAGGDRFIKPYIMAGPVASFLIQSRQSQRTSEAGSLTTSWTNLDVSQNFSKAEVGVNVSTGIDLNLTKQSLISEATSRMNQSWVGIMFSYYAGLTSMNRDSELTTRNSTFAVSLRLTYSIAQNRPTKHH